MAIGSLTRDALIVSQTIEHQPFWSIQSGSRIRTVVLALDFVITGSSSNIHYVVGRPINLIVPLTRFKILQENPDDAEIEASVSVSWSVAPVMPAATFRRSSASASGVVLCHLFPRGLIIAPNASLAIWNSSILAVGSAQGGIAPTVTVEE